MQYYKGSNEIKKINSTPASKTTVVASQITPQHPKRTQNIQTLIKLNPKKITLKKKLCAALQANMNTKQSKDKSIICKSQ
uniref:Uncharacterized protein n=1 Tax=Rhizophora mucronata TaxID=61149 RepID=A0A2P2PG01_RHIMU